MSSTRYFTCLALGITLLTASCATQRPLVETTPASCCSDLAGEPLGRATSLPGTSIYHHNGRWQDQNGLELSFASLSGTPRLLAMFFSTCEYACPIIIGDLKKLEAGISERQRDQLQITLASFDVERDTPTALAEYANRMGLEKDHWTLLHGEDDDVRELAAVLGVKYRREENGSFAHSNIIFLVDANGEIVHQQVGLATDPAEMLKALRGLLTSSAPN